MHVYLRGDILQRLRLISGLILFVFAGTHFLNHGLGLVGLEVMHRAQDLRTSITRSVPGSIVLLLALLIHMALSLYKTSRRSTWRMPRWELAQIATGLAIPFLLLPHIVNTRIAHTLFGVRDSYLYELTRLWPDSAWQQSTLLLLVWVHGCIGLHHWLRLSDRYKSAKPVVLVIAVAVPVLALAGFAVSGQTVSGIMSDAEALAALKERSHWPDGVESAALAQWRNGVRTVFGVLALTAVVMLVLRARSHGHAGGDQHVIYSGGPTVRFEPGQTLLDVSRIAGVPHASVCGGRARCTTCRVRIESGLDSLPLPEGAEAATLKAIDAPSNVRLACQVRPSRSITVSLVSAPGTPGPVQLEFGEVKAAVAAHARAQLTGQFVESESSDPTALADWFQRKLGHVVAMPEVAMHVAKLSGGRIDYLESQRVAAAVYVGGDEIVSVFITPRDGAAQMIRARRNKYRVVGWSDERAHYLAVTSSAKIELEQFASGHDGSTAEQQTAEVT